MDPSVPTFAVTMVANSGAYASGWWWYYGQTASQVSALLSANKARLISIDPYQTSAGLRFALVMVPNAGAQAPGVVVVLRHQRHHDGAAAQPAPRAPDLDASVPWMTASAFSRSS